MATEGRRVGLRSTQVLVVGAAGLAVAAVLNPGVVFRADPPEVVEAPSGTARDGIWISTAEIDGLPISGPAWESVADYALSEWGEPDISDQNSDHDVHTLAGALYAARLDDDAMAQRVADALGQVEGTFSDEILALSRNLLSYVIAADVTGYRSDTFDQWLDTNLTRPGHSRAGIETLLESALRDPSNHGAHARASVIAIARYRDDTELVGRVAGRFHDWLGRSSDGFEWRELDWQSDARHPRGVNQRGARIDGVDVDGVMPEEQRRSGGWKPVPDREPYVWEGLQGTIATAHLLARAGFEPWQWEDRALVRAVDWLYEINGFPAEGDDRWIPWVVNAAYDTTYPVESPTRPGKSVGFTDWTHHR